jgi:hypothetical protein
MQTLFQRPGNGTFPGARQAHHPQHPTPLLKQAFFFFTLQHAAKDRMYIFHRFIAILLKTTKLRFLPEECSFHLTFLYF